MKAHDGDTQWREVHREPQHALAAVQRLACLDLLLDIPEPDHGAAGAALGASIWAPRNPSALGGHPSVFAPGRAQSNLHRVRIVVVVGMATSPGRPGWAILGVHQIKQKPVVRDGQIIIGEVMLLSLSFDHRVVDGHVGAAFAYEIIKYLHDPDALFLEG